MADVSALCAQGKHEITEWGSTQRVGCRGFARDMQQGKYRDHNCLCSCHAEETVRVLVETAQREGIAPESSSASMG